MSENPGTPDRFTLDFDEVRSAERVYLDERRANNGLPDTRKDGALWGLALSGGGVRSATFGLGLLQSLIRAGLLKRFDYLSTVSGGGYIGSCLTSLLTNRADTGLDDANSPFTGLNVRDGYEPPDRTRLSVRHQIHHLRTHGEYLIPNSHLFSRDVQRATGSVLSGMTYTLGLFFLLLVIAVAATHLLLSAVDPDLQVLAPSGGLSVPGSEAMGYAKYVTSVLAAWYDLRLAPPFRHAWAGAARHAGLLLWTGLIGVIWSIIWIFVATAFTRREKLMGGPPLATTRAGWTAEGQLESTFVRVFNVTSVVLAVGLMFLQAMLYRGLEPDGRFLVAMISPFAFSVGGLLASHGLTYVQESALVRRAWLLSLHGLESRFRRSLHASLRGACLYGSIAAVVVPAAIVLMFSLSALPLKFFLSIAALGWSWYLTRGRTGAAAKQLGGWLHRPLSNLAVLLFLGFAFATVSDALLVSYREYLPGAHLALVSLVVIAVVALPFVLLGTFVDANRVAPHYFYRDRLTEAYLRTCARTRRPDLSRQGMPLTVLRDDEDLKIQDVGGGNGRGPYHLVVTALNLSGSQELNRKSFLSEHFVFSRDYIGSRVTGWVRSSVYRSGTTRLARAMAISAAAVGSAMGYHTFGGQAFIATLFNARLGYWMENPWRYRAGTPAVSPRGRTFWPWYLFLEVFGLTSARTRMVNLSDGGHTGDNLGLLPLLRRRCGTILVSDAEADSNYAFGSFNNAVRMALIEEDIRMEIDLTPIMSRHAVEGGYSVSKESVVAGSIHYPETLAGEAAFTGRLIYVKSSVSGEAVPVHVLNYLKGHAHFPHEPTADQFFDDAQFEAYRALGEHIGRTAALRLQ